MSGSKGGQDINYFYPQYCSVFFVGGGEGLEDIVSLESRRFNKRFECEKKCGLRKNKWEVNG